MNMLDLHVINVSSKQQHQVASKAIQHLYMKVSDITVISVSMLQPERHILEAILKQFTILDFRLILFIFIPHFMKFYALM